MTGGAAPRVILVSFEGPDPYAMAGGLGQRVTTLADAFAASGADTHLYFLGDPDRPGEERAGAHLTLHRWAQWVSRHHPLGVYAGEEDKRTELTHSLPPRLEAMAEEAVRQGRPCLLLFEDWQCAEAALRTAWALAARGLAGPGRAVVAHNTNTLMSVHRARLHDLRDRAVLLTVSRFMKHALWAHAVNPVVVPNGLPPEAYLPPDAAAEEAVSELRRAGRTVLVKVARFDPDKAWLAAIEAVARLKGGGGTPLLLMRGGLEGHAHEVLALAGRLGLAVRDGMDGAHVPTPQEAAGVDVWHFRRRIPDGVLRALYAAATCVLAQSGIEPFGLVGLEVMAQGGTVMVGATGEDYARHGRNALVAETAGAAEVAHLVRRLESDPALDRTLRRHARQTARLYAWRQILPEMLDRTLFAWGEG